MRLRLIIPLWVLIAAFFLSACGGAPAAQTDAPPVLASAPVSTGDPAPSQPPSSATPPAQTPTPAPTATPVQTETPAPTTSPPPVSVPEYWDTGWLPLGQEAEIGTIDDALSQVPHTYAVLYEVRAQEDALLFVFVPPAWANGILGFIERGAAIPPTVTHSRTAEQTFALEFWHTALETGDPAEFSGSDDWVYDWVNEYGVSYPCALPEGEMETGCPLLETVLIERVGDGVMITLTMVPGEWEYALTTEKLMEDMYPAVRLSLRGAGEESQD